QRKGLHGREGTLALADEIKNATEKLKLEFVKNFLKTFIKHDYRDLFYRFASGRKGMRSGTILLCRRGFVNG
ncbi:MAG: hypothetical protein ABS901_08185, partial [Candidatus Limivicinus sp.]